MWTCFSLEVFSIISKNSRTCVLDVLWLVLCIASNCFDYVKRMYRKVSFGIILRNNILILERPFFFCFRIVILLL